MNSLIFLLLLLTMFVLIGRPTIKIEKKSISSDELTNEQIAKLYKKKPALAWKMHLAKSFAKFQDDFADNAKWWQTNIHVAVNKTDCGIIGMLIMSTSQSLSDNYKKLKKLKRFWVHILLWFNDPNNLTKKLFGKDIFDICLKLNVLKAIKNQFESKPYFDILLDKNALSEMLARSIISPKAGQNFINELLQPVITKELLISEIEKTSVSLNMKVPNNLMLLKNQNKKGLD